MRIESIIKMDLAQRTVMPRVDAVQGDQNTRVVLIKLYNRGTPMEFPEGLTAIVHYVKADSTGGSYDTLPDNTRAYSFDGNVVSITLAPQVLSVAGPVRMAVALLSGSEVLNTFAIGIDVQANPGCISKSEDYYCVQNFVPSSGWTANKVLGTDADGNVVPMDPPSGGATEEQLAQIQTNAENIEAIQTELDESPVVVDDNGYTDIVGLRRGVHTDFVFADEQITVTTTMQGGVTVEGVLTFGADGLPEKYTEDGIEHTMTWTGFENAGSEEMTDVSEVGA